jgi:hypothetical protein
MKCHHNDGKTTTAIEHTVPDAGRFPTERTGRKPGRKPATPGKKPGRSTENSLLLKTLIASESIQMYSSVSKFSIADLFLFGNPQSH